MPGNDGANAMTQFMNLNSHENSTLSQKIYGLRQYFILSIAEIITGFWEKKQLRASEIALFSLIQEGHNALSSNYSEKLLSSFLKPFRKNLLMYFGTILLLNIIKSVIRCFRNMTFTDYNTQGKISTVEQRFEEVANEDGANISQFDNDRNNLPKIAKTYFGLTQKIINISIDVYIFSSLLSPFPLFIVLCALALSYLVTSSLSKPSANAKGTASKISSIYLDLKNIISKDGDNSEELREYIRKKEASKNQGDPLIAELLRDRFKDLTDTFKSPENKQAALNILSGMLATRTQENLKSKMIDIASDVLNKLIEKALSCLMLFLGGCRVIANKAAPGIMVADMVWLTATLKTTSDANKTFLNYVRAIKDHTEMQTTLNRIISAFPKQQRKEFNEGLFPTYFPNTLPRLCLYAGMGLTIANLYLGASLLQPLVVVSQIVGASAFKVFTFSAVIASFTALRNSSGSTLDEKIADINGRLITYSLIGLLGLHSTHLIFSGNVINIFRLLISMHASYAAFISHIAIIPLSLTLPIMMGSYLLAGITLYAFAKKFDQHAFQVIAAIVDITTTVINQTLASICFAPEYICSYVPYLKQSNDSSIITAKVHNFIVEPILALIIFGLFTAPQLFIPLLGSLPKSIWLAALLLPLVDGPSTKNYLKNIPIAVLLLTLPLSYEYIKLYLPLLSLTATSILMMPLAMLSAVSLHKFIIAPTHNAYHTQIDKIPEPKKKASWPIIKSSKLGEMMSSLSNLVATP